MEKISRKKKERVLLNMLNSNRIIILRRDLRLDQSSTGKTLHRNLKLLMGLRGKSQGIRKELMIGIPHQGINSGKDNSLISMNSKWRLMYLTLL